MTTIEWTDETWNPAVGCSKVSAGCNHCYAEAVHKARLSGQHGYPVFRPWSKLNAEHNVTMLPARLDQPLRWRKPRMIFVNSMSDLFHELLPVDFICQVFAAMALAPQHTFQVLTKRPERMADLLSWEHFPRRVRDAILRMEGKPAEEARERLGYHARGPLPAFPLLNVWLGTSIENRKWVGRADALRETPAAIRFISAEPLLGPLIAPVLVDLPVRAGGIVRRFSIAAWPDGTTIETHPSLNLTGVDWLIVGGESGAKHRPMDPQWVRDLRDECLERRRCECDRGERTPLNCWSCSGRTGPAFFFKQVGGATPKAGGRELDGRTWDEYPVPPLAGVSS